MEFETKDSGQRVDFESGMRRDTDNGKPRYDLIPDFMLKRWASLMARGAVKYGTDNWRMADSQEELKRFKSSALRHMYQWKCGDTDEDHAAAVLFNIAAAEYLKDKIGTDINGERWAQPTILAKHEVSTSGRVRNIVNKKIYAQWKNCHGYLLVSLSGEARKHYQVHRLVANAFLGDIQDMQVNHIDGHKTNNNLMNLEYVTAKENALHAKALNLSRPPQKGKLTFQDAEDIREMVGDGNKQRDIAKLYGVSPQAINDLVNGRTWKSDLTIEDKLNEKDTTTDHNTAI